jgi:hypothetical protein
MGHPQNGFRPERGRTSVQTAIVTVCLSGTLNEKLEAIAAAHFKGVEIFENDLLSFDGTPENLSPIRGPQAGAYAIASQSAALGACLNNRRNFTRR